MPLLRLAQLGHHVHLVQNTATVRRRGHAAKPGHILFHHNYHSLDFKFKLKYNICNITIMI